MYIYSWKPKLVRATIDFRSERWWQRPSGMLQVGVPSRYVTELWWSGNPNHRKSETCIGMSQNVNRRMFASLDLQFLLPVLWECRNVPRVKAIEKPCQAQLWSPGKAWKQIVAIQVCLETLREIERHFVRDFPVACYLQDPVQMIGPLMVKPELGNPKSLRQWSGTCHLVVRFLFECLPCINLVIRKWLRRFGLEFPKTFVLKLRALVWIIDLSRH